jgi:DNA-binding IclR family transcriptional regulator
LNQEFAAIRERGYVVSDGENLPDASGIAAPVFGPRGIVGCICLTSPKARMPHGDIAAIGLKVAEHAAALSRLLGAQAHPTSHQ